MMFSSTVVYYHGIWRSLIYNTITSSGGRENMLQNSGFSKVDRLWQGTTKGTGPVRRWLADASKLYIMIIVDCPHKKWHGRCVEMLKYVNHVWVVCMWGREAGGGASGGSCGLAGKLASQGQTPGCPHWIGRIFRLVLLGTVCCFSSPMLCLYSCMLNVSGCVIWHLEEHSILLWACLSCFQKKYLGVLYVGAPEYLWFIWSKQSCICTELLPKPVFWLSITLCGYNLQECCVDSFESHQKQSWMGVKDTRRT